MSQSPQAASPLTARLYKLEYPRSLGVYSTYAEVQAVVDTLADNHFPVQNAMIVGTDLKLMERVTGRKTWGRVIGQGVLSGVWMGLFVGLILLLINPSSPLVILSSVLLGIVFFTVWAVIGYAATGGKRDFTSMVATIPMQYELMVEHSHAEAAREILARTGAGGPVPGGAPGVRTPTGPQAAVPTTGAHAAQPYGPASPATGPASPAPGSAPRPSYGRPATGTAPESEAAPAPHRPSYGRPAGAEQHAPSAPQAPSAQQGQGAAQPQQPPQAPASETTEDDASR